MERPTPDEFVSTVCLCYDDPHFDHRSFHARGSEMLRACPELAEASIWAAAAAGNTGAVDRFLDRDPKLVNAPGPHGWLPLVCACYSRVRPPEETYSTFEVARLLLERGADPNAHTLKGNADGRLEQAPRRFTALTGVFGGGSTGLANQPPHPRWREMAELLLERGADPADEEAIQNNPSACLEILLKYGLSADAPARRAIGSTPHGATLAGRALARAAREGDVERVRLLLRHGARVNELFDGRTPWQHAMEFGHREIARMLEDAGAAKAPLDEVESFVSACMAGDAGAARAMLERSPGLLGQAPKDLVFRATGTGRIEAVRLALDLGFDPNRMDEVAAVHQSDVLADHPEILRLLVERGASLTLREPFYDGTAVEWADFFDHKALLDELLSRGAICLFDALDHDRLERVSDILARDPEALERPFAKCLSREPRPEDWQTPLLRMVTRGKAAAVRVLLQHGADRGARDPDGRSLVEVARENGHSEVVELLERG